MTDCSEDDAMDFRPWFRDKEFTADWLTVKLPFWLAPLQPWTDKKAEVLEVGSYEGRSAVAFLEYLPYCRLTAVDIFVDPAIEGRFDRNMAPYGERVVKVKDRAMPAMEKMLDNKTFDIIYLDTGKTRSVAFANSALAWPLLREGGILIWDDTSYGAEIVPITSVQSMAFANSTEPSHRAWMYFTKVISLLSRKPETGLFSRLSGGIGNRSP